MKKEKEKRHFNARSVARIARYAHRDGADKCEIVALVLFALGYGNIMCRILKYINLSDYIVSVVEMAYSAITTIIEIAAATIAVIEIANTGVLLIGCDVAVTAIEVAEVALGGLPALTSTSFWLVEVRNFITALQPFTDIAKAIEEIANFKELKEKFDELEEITEIVKTLECWCNAWKNISMEDVDELLKNI